MYRLIETDMNKGGQVLGRAFKDDPIWTGHIKDPVKRAEILPQMFQFLLYMGNRFGDVLSPSENLEGIAVLFSRKYADVGLIRLVFSGLIFKIGDILKKYSKDMKHIQKEMKIVSKDRKRLMKGRDYLYLNCLGVEPQLQGKGYGGQILKHIFEISTRKNVPLYLETETEENFRMYSHYGFKLIGERDFSGTGLHLWQMVREVS